ncbi:MAG: hypothetical protein AB7O88_21825 [Reyranellaceae bacterium]
MTRLMGLVLASVLIVIAAMPASASTSMDGESDHRAGIRPPTTLSAIEIPRRSE